MIGQDTKAWRAHGRTRAAAAMLQRRCNSARTDARSLAQIAPVRHSLSSESFLCPITSTDALFWRMLYYRPGNVRTTGVRGCS